MNKKQAGTAREAIHKLNSLMVLYKCLTDGSLEQKEIFDKMLNIMKECINDGKEINS